MSKQERIARLPKWAQDEISRLEKDLAASEREVREIKDRGDFVHGDYNDCRVPPRLSLHTAKSGVEWGAIRATFEADDVLEVSNTGGLLIELKSSNVALIRSKDF